MSIRLQRRKEGRARSKQIAQNAGNGSGFILIRISFMSDWSRGLHRIYIVSILLTKAKPVGCWTTFDFHFTVS